MSDQDDALSGLSSVERDPLERHLIRTRGMEFTRAAWRLRLRCSEGEGTIVLAEVAPDESYYRGEGLFLGWSQARLKTVYETCFKDPSGDEPIEIPQLG